MNKRIEVRDDVYYIGVNDRRTELFENLWPIPLGVSYNAYLIDDEKTVLVETVEARQAGLLLDHLKEVLGDKPLDYLVLNHVEPDHSGSLKDILGAYPEVCVVGNKKTLGLIERFYGFEGAFLEVKNGDCLDLGGRELAFYLTPMVHWPETMMTYDRKSKCLFSGDAFGSFGTLDGAVFDDEMDVQIYVDEMRRYFSNIVGKYSGMVQRALVKLEGLELGAVCPTHGPVWRGNPERVVGLYDRWSKQEAEEGVVIVFGSMYGHTESMADRLARLLVEQGVKKVFIFDASKTHMSTIISYAWKYKGLMLGSCAYNTGMLPTMDALCRKLAVSGLANRMLGIFGNYSWSGGGVKSLEAFACESGFEVIGSSIEVKSVAEQTDDEKLLALAKNMVERFKA
jgi:flavorubredoxin